MIYEASRLTFLAWVFPLSVALMTLALLVAAFVLSSRNRPSYVLHDSERDWTAEERPVRTVLHLQSWMLELLGAIAPCYWVLMPTSLIIFAQNAFCSFMKEAKSSSESLVICWALTFS